MRRSAATASPCGQPSHISRRPVKSAVSGNQFSSPRPDESLLWKAKLARSGSAERLLRPRLRSVSSNRFSRLRISELGRMPACPAVVFQRSDELEGPSHYAAPRAVTGHAKINEAPRAGVSVHLLLQAWAFDELFLDSTFRSFSATSIPRSPPPPQPRHRQPRRQLLLEKRGSGARRVAISEHGLWAPAWYRIPRGAERSTIAPPRFQQAAQIGFVSSSEPRPRARNRS